MTARVDNIADGLSLPTLDGTRPGQSKAGIMPRVVVMDDVDSRECPSQGAGEVARENLFLRGVDERRGHGFGPQLRASSTQIFYTRSFLQHRSCGPRRQSTGSFRERRESNSFDAYDCKYFRRNWRVCSLRGGELTRITFLLLQLIPMMKIKIPHTTLACLFVMLGRSNYRGVKRLLLSHLLLFLGTSLC